MNQHLRLTDDFGQLRTPSWKLAEVDPDAIALVVYPDEFHLLNGQLKSRNLRRLSPIESDFGIWRYA